MSDDDILQSVEYLSAGFNYNCGIFKTLSNLSKVVCWGQDARDKLTVPDLNSIEIKNNDLIKEDVNDGLKDRIKGKVNSTYEGSDNDNEQRGSVDRSSVGSDERRGNKST